MNFYSKINGLLKIDPSKLYRINLEGVVILYSKQNDFPVHSDNRICTLKMISENSTHTSIEKTSKLLAAPLLWIKKYTNKRVSLITVENDVFTGVKDNLFFAKINDKVKPFGSHITFSEIVPEDIDYISKAIERGSQSSDVVIITGSLLDKSNEIVYQAMKESGFEPTSRSLPMEPGSNFMIGNNTHKIICAIPPSILKYKATALDVFLPKIFAGETVPIEEIAKYGYGGLCHYCTICTFPICTFGKCL